MIRSYKKKPIKIQNIDYQKLLILTIKEKYASLFLGLLSSLIITSLTYNFFLKNIKFDLSIKFPSKVKKERIVVQKPQKTYIVVEGDDLWNIAEKFYGSGFNAYDISVANKISESSSLEVGTKLIIPEVSPRETTIGETSSVSTTQVTYVENKYVVQPGDSLSIIAQKVYGDLFAWPRIMNANGLASPDAIEAGMVLIIPRQ